MSSGGAGESPLRVVWSEKARADMRAIDRVIAMDILHCLGRYLATRSGDVVKLKPPLPGFRLRCGDYRLFFRNEENPSVVEITGVGHRREVYR